jgi:pimeloyl-ACP methyl ester carboxylesterase
MHAHRDSCSFEKKEVYASSFHLIGHNLGGAVSRVCDPRAFVNCLQIALAYASCFPQQIKKLALLSPAGFFPIPFIV